MTSSGEGGKGGAARDASGFAVGRLGFPRKGPRAPCVDDASGLPVDCDAPERRRPARSIGAAAADLLLRLGVAVDAPPAEDAALDAMLAAWPDVAGEELRGRLEPEKFVGGVLYVFARNSTELFEIRRYKLRDLEARARRHAAFAGLRQIRARVR